MFFKVCYNFNMRTIQDKLIEYSGLNITELIKPRSYWDSDKSKLNPKLSKPKRLFLIKEAHKKYLKSKLNKT